ncbi:MAG: pantoate--beta-alanine ligase [Gammaproteobacteria bacterium]|nr:pantoate--beta-alanine ligase [Gammaproteobacteria bacterium]
MRQVSSITALRVQVASWRQEGLRIGFVPTMGNLHSGHIRLVDHARSLCDRVVVSIFVNPLQFGAGEDLDTYPRTIDEDTARLKSAGAALLFLPEVSDIYPGPQDEQTRVEVPDLSDILCGNSRPGHFVGVSTVVCKLFNMVQSDIALFGEKDYQQLMVIRKMVVDLAIPVEIEGVATVREDDGLAMSSRNGYLTPKQRQQAPALYRVINQSAERIRGGDRDYLKLQDRANSALVDSGFTPDYFYIRRADNLKQASQLDHSLVILAAAHLGEARLIDNMRVDVTG